MSKNVGRVETLRYLYLPINQHSLKNRMVFVKNDGPCTKCQALMMGLFFFFNRSLREDMTLTPDMQVWLEKAMASHSNTVAWRIPWMEEPGGLQSVRLLRVGHD